jgi:hypothetical protein
MQSVQLSVIDDWKETLFCPEKMVGILRSTTADTLDDGVAAIIIRGGIAMKMEHVHGWKAVPAVMMLSYRRLIQPCRQDLSSTVGIIYWAK